MVGGRGKARVTNNDTNDLSPSYSPDGKKIAYVSSNGRDWDIYTVNVGGGSRTRVTNNDKYDFSPSYSPSGEKIAYECSDGNESVSADVEICTINVRGGGKFQVTHNDTDDHNPDYSPNGNRIVYEGFEGSEGDNDSDDASTNIYTIKVGGRGKFRVTKNDTPDYGLSWGSRP
jgi:TolB protein